MYEKYEINKKFSFLSDFRHFNCYEKIQYKKINFDEILKPAYNLDETREFDNRFVKVKDAKECFLVIYE